MNRKTTTTKRRQKNMRRVSVLVTAQTAHNLEKLACMSGCGRNVGRAIDKLVREKMLSLGGDRTGARTDKAVDETKDHLRKRTKLIEYST